MTRPDPPRILVVDDEEAILETMSFTFMDAYEVLTSADAATGLRILEEKSPIAVVLTDSADGNQWLADVIVALDDIIFERS